MLLAIPLTLLLLQSCASKEVKEGDLVTRQYGVEGTVYTDDEDDSILIIKNFKYTGKGPGKKLKVIFNITKSWENGKTQKKKKNHGKTINNMSMFSPFKLLLIISHSTMELSPF